MSRKATRPVWLWIPTYADTASTLRGLPRNASMFVNLVASCPFSRTVYVCPTTSISYRCQVLAASC
jgi:hypothetical protein